MSKSKYKQTKKQEQKPLTDEEVKQFRKDFKKSVFINNVKTNNALQYIIQLLGYTQVDISNILGENKEIVTKWFSKSTKENIKTLKKRKINNKTYVINLENILGVSKEYWLDERNLTRDLTKELKREIDLYLLKKYEEINESITYKVDVAYLEGKGYDEYSKNSEVEINAYPYEETIMQIKTDLLKEDIKHIINDIIYICSNNPSISLNRAILLTQLLTEVNRIDIFNLQDLIQQLKEYPSKQIIQIEMTPNELEQYLDSINTKQNT